MTRELRRTAALVVALWVATPAGARGQEDYRSLGSQDAPLEMVIYSDFECPFCRNFALAALPAIRAEFVETGRLRVRYVYFPLAAIHPNAVATAKAAHCAGRAGRFWDYHDYLFVRQPEWAGAEAPDSLWVAYAQNLQLEPADFATCLDEPETQAFVEADLRRALLHGASGTPTIVLDGESIAGITSYEELRRTVIEALGAADHPPPDDRDLDPP